MKPGDLVEYIVEGGEKIPDSRRRFYLTLWCESFDDEFLVWWCIPINMKYNNITWINAQTLIKINDI